MTISTLFLDLYGCRRFGTRVVINVACKPNYPVMAGFSYYMLTVTVLSFGPWDGLGVQFIGIEAILVRL